MTQPSSLASNGRLSNWQVPVIGVGTGMWRWEQDALSQAQVDDLVRVVLSSGRAFFDTAPRYGAAFSEQSLGRALRGVTRSAYLLASKTGLVPEYDAAVDTRLTRDVLLRGVEASLKRLGTDYLDILHLHDPDCCLQEALDVAFPVLLELRDQGVVRAVGAGMNQWQMLAEFARRVDVDCFLLAGRYTLLEQEALPLLDLCQRKGIALFLGGVYNSGILATGAQPGAYYNYQSASPEILQRVARMEALCQRYQAPLRAAAVQFPLAHPAVRALILGVRSVQEFGEALATRQFPIPPALWRDLRAEGLIDPSAPAPGLPERTDNDSH